MEIQQLYKAFVLALILLFPCSSFAEDMVNINTATAAELASAMSGIGSSKAEAIVADREANGPFRTVDDLSRVKGVGSATVNKNLDRITVGNSE